MITKYTEYLDDFKKKSISLIVDSSKKFLDFANEINDIIINYQDDSDFDYNFEILQLKWKWDRPMMMLKQKNDGEITLKMDVDSKNGQIGGYAIDDFKKIIEVLSEDVFNVDMSIKFENISDDLMLKIKNDITNRYHFLQSRLANEGLTLGCLIRRLQGGGSKSYFMMSIVFRSDDL